MESTRVIQELRLSIKTEYNYGMTLTVWLILRSTHKGKEYADSRLSFSQTFSD